MEKNYIYLDNAATTKISDEAISEMMPCFTEYYGNPSSAYGLASYSRSRINGARRAVASLINADSNEIFFTSGGTESDNMAIRGTAEYYLSTHNGRPGKIITTAVEHPAVLNTVRSLKKRGFTAEEIMPDRYGVIAAADVEKAITPDTFLVSVMTANNETGAIEPVKEIGIIAHEHGCVFHTDAVQAFGQIPMDVSDMNIDMLSASGHKIYGPMGVGMLYIRSGTKILPFISGGMQERGRRAGTENVPGICGFGKAAELAGERMTADAAKEIKLRDKIINRLTAIEGVTLNGPENVGCMRLPGNVNLMIDGVYGETLVIKLDMEGICISSGSACATGSTDPSHVLKAMGKSDEEARSSVRISLGRYNTEEETERAVNIIKDAICRIRKS